ncbi:MAG: macro domain-containing protein [Actinobacteria bacterium]|nr:macro domain-containing protein [Actinomycetota bacterium]
MEQRFAELTVELVQGDIVDQPDLDAIVNAANAELRPGGGVAGAIHRAAGAGLAEEAVPLGPIAPGECVLTGGHALPNPHVLHCLGPVHGRDEPGDELLASCYRRALETADEHRLASIGFPAISTGVFGYPVREAAEVALRTIRDVAPDLRTVRLVRMVLHSRDDLAVHREVLGDLAA